MPYFDTTGPMGAGPGTGRCCGPCCSGTGRRGNGRGFGFRRLWTKTDETNALNEEEKALKEELKAVQEEIKNLKDKK